MTSPRDSFDAAYARFERDWEGVPNMTRNAFARWWHDAFRPELVEPWFPPFCVAAAMPDAALSRIRQMGRGGIRAIRNRARARTEGA